MPDGQIKRLLELLAEPKILVLCLTVVIVFVPLDIGDHAGHVHCAEEARRVAHGQAHVLRRLQDVGEAAHFYWREKQD